MTSAIELIIEQKVPFRARNTQLGVLRLMFIICNQIAVSVDPHYTLTHWGGVTHICVSKLSIIGLDNDLSPGRCQAVIWTNVGIFLMGPLGTNLSEILIEIHTLSLKKMYLKNSSGKWWPFCFGLNVLRQCFEDMSRKFSSCICCYGIPYSQNILLSLWLSFVINYSIHQPK